MNRKQRIKILLKKFKSDYNISTIDDNSQKVIINLMVVVKLILILLLKKNFIKQIID